MRPVAAMKALNGLSISDGLRAKLYKHFPTEAVRLSPCTRSHHVAMSTVWQELLVAGISSSVGSITEGCPWHRAKAGSSNLRGVGTAQRYRRHSAQATTAYISPGKVCSAVTTKVCKYSQHNRRGIPSGRERRWSEEEHESKQTFYWGWDARYHRFAPSGFQSKRSHSART